MKNRSSKKLRLTVITMAVLLACAVLAAIWAPLFVDGQVVTWAEYHYIKDGDPAASHDELVQQIITNKMIQIWAWEEGLLSKPTVEQLIEQNPPSSSYGPSKISRAEQYRYGLMEARTQLIASLSRDANEQQLEAYYNDNIDQYRQANKITALCVTWEDGRAISTTEISVDAQSVRVSMEANELLTEALLSLSYGESVLVHEGANRYYQLTCIGFEEGGYEPFEDVQQAVAVQYAENNFNQLLKERTNNAHFIVNPVVFLLFK